jgi:peptidoglycan L-alanyl-D-glutamate endopeptidase CwlK
MSVETADNKLSHLYPEFAEKVKAILKQATIETMGKHGVNTWIMFEGYRSQARQDWLYAQGRTRPGAIVTHRHHSNHSDGMAADCYPTDIHGNIMWEAHEEVWQQFGHCVRTHGMQWGGDYPKITGGTFVDQPHVEPKPRQRLMWEVEARVHLHVLGLLG